MSIKTQTKFCNCNISSNKIILDPKVDYSFCQKCGCILLKGSQGKIYYTLKVKHKIQEIEINPINIVKTMKMKTEEKYPNIYNLYNSSPKDKNKDDNSINIYLKYRKMLIIKLQKLMKSFDYCDIIFYQTLFFLDTYLSRDITELMPEKTIYYYLIGYFLCALKLKEVDIYEPSFDSFFEIEKGIYLSPNKIGLYEVLCIKRIEYNIFSYSAYDWLNILLSNGIIFNSEVDDNNEIIIVKGHRHSLVNTVKKYAIKLLLNLTLKDNFFKYSPMYMAFSLIQIAREKYIEHKMIKPKLFFKLINLYGVNFSDYQQCYEELLIEIKEENNRNTKDKETKLTIQNYTEEKNNNIKRRSVEKTFIKNKNIYIPNKIRSSQAVINFKKDSINETKDDINNHNIKPNNKNHKNARDKIKLNQHLSIDCSNNVSKINDNLQHISVNFTKEQKDINKLNSKSINYISLHKKVHNEEKRDSFYKLDNSGINNTNLIRNKLLTSKKLPKIKFEEITSNKVHNTINIEQNNEINDILNSKKHNKLKSNNNLFNKFSLP